MRLASALLRAPLILLALLALTGLPAQARNVVELRPAAEVALPDRQQASGSALAPHDAVIAAEITAVIAAVHAEAGRSVARGEALISLDERDAKLALAQAQAQLQAAQARLTLAQQRAERGRQLRAEKHISEDELLALETGLQAAQADLALARAARDAAARQVEKTRIQAPFDGVVLERQAQLGALATPGAPLMRLVSTEQAEVEAHIPPDAARDLEVAQEIVFETQGRRYPLRLLSLAPVLERSARTRLARFAFVDDAALAGSTGQVSWTGPRLLLPAELMVKRGGQLGAFIEREGEAQFIAAPTAEEGRPFRLDLPPEARIVTAGQQGLNPGDALPVRDQ
jgi:RND family efflux transporter MFP subunit